MTDPFSIELLTNYLLVGAALFALGMLGFISRRNLIVMFLSAEMMLQGVGLSLVAFGRFHGNWSGQIFTIIILTVAACEASIAMALVVVLFNRKESLDATLWQEIREPGVKSTELADEATQAAPIGVSEGPETYPTLTPAGIEPAHPIQPWTERRR